MGTILKNIVRFTGLTVGVPTSLPHKLNVNNIPVTPKIGGADEGGFDITANATNVTVTRQAGAPADVDVYVEYWHTMESVTPLIPAPGKLIGLTPLFFAGGSGGGTAQLLSLYGDGSYGDHTTAGDETWTGAAPPAGAPTIPGGAPYAAAFFNNLTISPGDSVAVGGFSPGENALVIFVKDTLTIGAGGRIHVNGADGSTGHNINGNSGGPGRLAILGSVDGGAGGTGGFGGLSRANSNGDPGGGGASRPAFATTTMVGGKGGDAQGNPGSFTGGAGGTCQPDASWPYSLSQAISIASMLYAIGGGNGGGGGAGAGSSGFGGGGGGGAGTLVIFAKNVIAPAGALQAIGGTGGNGAAIEGLGSGGGGGASGGSILIVTENTTLLGVTNVSGGAGGFPDGFPADPGVAGGPGAAIAFNPMLNAQIPV